MNKIMILMAGAAITMGATTAQAQISIAPEIGLNLANLHQKFTVNGTETKLDDGIKLGVKVGANVNIPVGSHLMIQPGLFYSIKGVKSEDEETIAGINYKDKNNITLHYFDVPVNVQYMFNDPGEGRFFIGVGPYLGVAFSGKNIFHSEYSGGGSTPFSQDTTIKLKFGSDYTANDLDRFDFGGQVNAGYQLRSGLFFRAMYQAGIANLVPEKSQPTGTIDGTVRSTNITISIGYTLGSSPAGKKKG